MKRFRKTAVLSTLLAFAIVLVSPEGIMAQSLLPSQISELFGLLGPSGTGSAQFITSRVQLALVLALGIVVLIAVVYSILAAIKYIQSQGDAGKIEEAQKSIQAIFMGIGAMLLAIVGIVIVFVFFGASRPDPALYQVCLTSPNSEGCQSCLNGDDPGTTGNRTSTPCGQCEEYFETTVQDNPGWSYQQLVNNLESYAGGICAP